METIKYNGQEYDLPVVRGIQTKKLYRVAAQNGQRIQDRDLEKLLLKKYTERENRKARDQAMKDLGLTKVKGALGGTYWE